METSYRRANNMTFSEWKSLTESEQKEKCQYLDPYEEGDVFKGVENEFLKQYGEQAGVDNVHCGQGPFLGPQNSIVVDIKGDEARTNLPEVFLGFPVIVEHKGK
jgi:hypothetical protein